MFSPLKYNLANLVYEYVEILLIVLNEIIDYILFFVMWVIIVDS